MAYSWTKVPGSQLRAAILQGTKPGTWIIHSSSSPFQGLPRNFLQMMLMPEEPPPFASETEQQKQVVKELNWPSPWPVAT